MSLLERIYELEPLRTVRVEPPRGEDRHPFLGQAAHGEGERLGRRLVDPLQVVDRQQHRPVLGEQAQRGQGGREDRALLGPFAGRVEQQRHLERSALRRRHARADVGQGGAEHVGQRRERQLRLAARRAGGQDADAALSGYVLAVPPERRLAHARFGLEQQGGGRGGSPGEGADRGQLARAAKKLRGRRLHRRGKVPPPINGPAPAVAPNAGDV